jgi:hypothetical protein
MVLETLVFLLLNHLTQLVAQEYFIIQCRCESYKSYINAVYTNVYEKHEAYIGNKGTIKELINELNVIQRILGLTYLTIFCYTIRPTTVLKARAEILVSTNSTVNLK